MNLQDRMQSGQASSKSSETTMKEKRNCCDTGSSLKNPERKSDPDSEAYVIMEQQSKVIAQLTEQRDHLIAEGRPEDRKKIEELTDHLSLVKKELMRRDSAHQSSMNVVQTMLESVQTENTNLKEELTRSHKRNYTLRSEIKELTSENEDLRKEVGQATRKAYLSLKERCDAAEEDNRRLQVMADRIGYERLLREKESLKEEMSRLLCDIETREAAADQKVRETEAKFRKADQEITSIGKFALISWLLLFLTVFGCIIGVAVLHMPS